ncbi:MAG: hypothetical protein GY699_21295 [Desulfobacteraceae bacterium]|nr:hypothetical protein [Desulfobacteraceae bacterium]
MASKKARYTIQVVIILAIFFFVLFNLVFKLIVDFRSDAIKKRSEVFEKQRIKHEFIAKIDDQYSQVQKLFQAEEYEKAIEIIKIFNKYGKSDYKDILEIKKEIRLLSLKKKLSFIPKIHLKEYMELSKDIDIEGDDSTEVFIRTPRYGQYFYTSDLPIQLEGVALSIKGDFSEEIIWTSSVDGELGKGKKIATRLSIGEHEITATGTNGITIGTMITRIFIEKEPDFLEKYNRK